MIKIFLKLFVSVKSLCDGNTAKKIWRTIKDYPSRRRHHTKKDLLFNEKVLITGGSGTVGTAFIKEFYGKYRFISYSRNERNK